MLRSDAFLSDNAATMPIVQPVEGIPTRTDIAFTDKAGKEKSGLRKDTEKALKNLAPALLRLLAKDEFVVYVAGACAPMSGIEQYTFGYFAQFVSRVTLVFTSQRILAFRVDTKGKWKNNLRGCWLGDIQSAQTSGFLLTRYLKLKYANGKQESYWAMKLRDKTKLKAILPKLLEANQGKTPAQAMQPLCPNCAAVLTDKHYECNACGQRFRSEDSLWWRTFIPGGAYFYAKQTGMGILHAIVDSFVTLDFLLVASAVFTATAAEKTSDFWIGLGSVAFFLFLERSIALWHARRFIREFIPIDGTARTTQAAAAGR